MLLLEGLLELEVEHIEVLEVDGQVQLGAVECIIQGYHVLFQEPEIA